MMKLFGKKNSVKDKVVSIEDLIKDMEKLDKELAKKNQDSIDDWKKATKI